MQRGYQPTTNDPAYDLTVPHIFGKSIRMASCDTNAAYDYTVSTTG